MNLIIIEISVFILFVYGILFIITGIKMVNNYPKNTPENCNEKSTILVPFRNEEFRIQLLLESVKKLQGIFEVIFIDDHSGDQTIGVIDKELKNLIIDYKVIENKGKGKKKAIQAGVEAAKYENIYVTDADCSLPDDWLLSSDKLKDFNFIKGPVLLSRPKKFFQIIPSVENMMLNAFILGYKKVLASGANLAYKKARFLEVDPYASNDHILSGDDMFLMDKLSESEIDFHFKIISTSQELSYWKLINQSVRWASKTKFLRNKIIAVFGSVVVITNFWCILLGILSLFEESLHNILLVFIGFKFVIDFLLLFLIAVLLNRYDVLKYSIIVELIYPLHLMLVIAFSMFNKAKWKGRSV